MGMHGNECRSGASVLNCTRNVIQSILTDGDAGICGVIRPQIGIRTRYRQGCGLPFADVRVSANLERNRVTSRGERNHIAVNDALIRDCVRLGIIGRDRRKTRQRDVIRACATSIGKIRALNRGRT